MTILEYFASRAANKAEKGRHNHLMIEYRDFKAFDESKFLEDVDSAPCMDPD